MALARALVRNLNAAAPDSQPFKVHAKLPAYYNVHAVDPYAHRRER